MIEANLSDYRWAVLLREEDGSWRAPEWFKQSREARAHLAEMEKLFPLREGYVVRASYELTGLAVDAQHADRVCLVGLDQMARVVLSFKNSDVETPAEHLRNALQLMRGDPALVATKNFLAIERRLVAAISLLEPEAHGGGEIKELGSELTCVHCGCTEASACSIDPDQLDPMDRAMSIAYYAEQELPVPDRVPCWWVSEDPAVCSNPSCQRARAGRVDGGR
jgi:hypothetical protein